MVDDTINHHSAILWITDFPNNPGENQTYFSEYQLSTMNRSTGFT